MNKSSESSYENQSEPDACRITWKEGGSGLLAGLFAVLCCAAPPLLGVLGLTGVATLLGSMSFTLHLVFQWIALGLIALTWFWFGWKISIMSSSNRWSPMTLGVGFILILVTVYIVKTWYAHVFLMG